MKNHHNLRRWVGIALLTLVTPATLSGLDLDPMLIGEWPPHPPGNPTGLEVRANYAYVVSANAGESWGHHLLVFDVTDRTDPQLKGYCAIPRSYGAAALAGHYAYVPTYSQGLQIVDVTDPTNPVPTRLVQPYIDQYGTCYTSGVAVIGNYAYTCIATQPYKWILHILDVSDPAAPVTVGLWAFTGALQRLVVAGNHAYLCIESSLQIIDITQPSQPWRVGEFQAWKTADVAISGDYAYVATEAGLSVLDISNPAHPFQIGTFRTQNRVGSVAVKDNIVCLGVNREGVYILDVSDPSQPRELALHDRHTNVHDLLIEGDHLFVADWTAGLHLVDLSTPGQTTVVGGYRLDGRAQDVVLSGHYAYVAAGGAGLWVIDVARPDRPQRVGHLDTTGFARSVFVKGEHAYLAQTHSGSGLKESLLVIDVAESANPRQVGSIATPGGAHDVEVVGDYAYLAASNEGLQIVRVADPTQPELVATFPVDGGVLRLAVAGEYVHMARSQANDLITIKVSPPTQPRWVGSLTDIGREVFVGGRLWALGPALAVEGNYAYLGGHGLVVFDLSNPASPVLASWCWGRPWVGGSRITAVDGRVFMDGSIVDVTDPLHPKRVGSLSGEGFAVAGDHVYVATCENGLRIYHLGRPANPQRLGWLEFPGLEDLQCVAVAGDHAYVATYHASEATYPVQLHVVDTSNSSAPSNLGAFAHFTAADIAAMMAYDQHLYVVGSSRVGLRVYHLQDPSAPRFVGHS